MISKVQKNSFGVRITPQMAQDTAKNLERGRILAPDLAMDIALRNFHQKSLQQQDQLVKSTKAETPTYQSFQSSALQAIFGNK